MISHSKKLLFILPVLFLFWISWRTYSYFFDTSKPTFCIYGIENNKYYSGDIECKIHGKDGYKVDYIAIYLDNKPLVSKFRINRKEFEYTLPILTKTLSGGAHELRIFIMDSSYNKNSSEDSIIFNVDNNPLQAAFVRPATDHKIFQGKTLHIQFQTNKPIKQSYINILSKNHKCYAEMAGSNIYECFIPIDCEENPSEYPFTITIEDNVGNSTKLEGKVQILPYPFKKQNLTIADEKLKEEQEIGIPQYELERQMEELTKNPTDHKLWGNSAFFIPIEMTRVSCDFGTIRTTQHSGCYMHKALDLIGRPKSVVWAPQDGIVLIKEKKRFLGLVLKMALSWT